MSRGITKDNSTRLTVRCQLGSLLLSMMLFGCGRHAPPAPGTTAFLRDTRATSPEAKAVPDKELLDLGHAVCGLYRDGKSIDSIEMQMGEQSKYRMPPQFIAAVVVTATEDLCPK
jgi:hypothetical protein